MNKDIRQCLIEELELFKLIRVRPLLVSRIDHPNSCTPSVQDIIVEALTKICLEYR